MFDADADNEHQYHFDDLKMRLNILATNHGVDIQYLLDKLDLLESLLE
jgi:hypothetical protein